MAKNQKATVNEEQDNLHFESTNKQNIVKAVSYNDEGKKQETFLFVLTEAQFDALIPDSSKRELAV